MIPNYRFGSEELPVQAGRYLLVVSPLCPYCRRVTIARRLLGLEAAIGVRYATGSGPDGFEFIRDGYSYDPLLMVRSARELYRRQPTFEPDDPQTVPVILDSQRDNQIVATESADMLLDFCTAWKPFSHFEAPDLYPKNERAKLDALDTWLNKQLVAPSWAVSHGEADGQTQRNFSLT
ncbi:MAG: glutathione transferase, partial [Varibaculum cambriense]|nr:glutathione transferase [Varibaculum cambriense]